jgi:hypothetical protein
VSEEKLRRENEGKIPETIGKGGAYEQGNNWKNMDTESQDHNR